MNGREPTPICSTSLQMLTGRQHRTTKSLADFSHNVGFTRSFGGALCQLFNTVKAYLAAKICPKCLPEPANAGPQGGGRRASLARRAEHPRSYGTAGSAARKSCCRPLLRACAARMAAQAYASNISKKIVSSSTGLKTESRIFILISVASEMQLSLDPAKLQL